MGLKEDIQGMAEKVASAYKKYSKTIVAIVIALNVLFTIAIFVYLYVGFDEPETLIEQWFEFTGKELLALAGIKVADTACETIVEVNTSKNDKLSEQDVPNESDKGE